jgi:hypothetical protein
MGLEIEGIEKKLLAPPCHESLMRRTSALFALLLAAPAAASAQVTVLDFEGLDNFASVGSFYSGVGAVFSDNALAGCFVTFQSNSCGNNGSRGGFGDPTSAATGMFFLDGGSTLVNVALGFNTGFSFFYSAPGSPASVQLFDGLNGTGNVVGAFVLPTTVSATCGPDYGSVIFCPFTPIGVAFDGTARSVVWSGVANQVVFDDITFGSDTPGRQDVVPEPATMTLLATGLAGMAAARKRRKTA